MSLIGLFLFKISDITFRADPIGEMLIVLVATYTIGICQQCTLP